MSLLDKISTWVKATANATVRGTGRHTRGTGSDAERTQAAARRQLAYLRAEIAKAKARRQRAEQAWRKAEAAGDTGAGELKKLYEQQLAFEERMQQEHDTLQKIQSDVDVVIAAERAAAKAAPTQTDAAQTTKVDVAETPAANSADIEARKARLAGGDKR
jgi:chromosome segregation ATPase